MAQSGSAPGWGPGGRRFKSCLPDRNSLQITEVSSLVRLPGNSAGNKVRRTSRELVNRVVSRFARTSDHPVPWVDFPVVKASHVPMISKPGATMKVILAAAKHAA